MEQKDPYEILGLRKDATRDEIVKRYNLLLKKYRSDNTKSANDKNAQIQEIEEAYNVLMGYDFNSLAEGKLSEEAKKPPNPLLKKLNIDEKKLGNFIHYYKAHMIIGTIVLISLFFIIRSIVTRVEPDLRLKLVGIYPTTSIEKLEEKIMDNIAGLKKVEIDPLIFWDKTNPNVEYSMEVKLYTLSGTGEVDAYFLDEERFEKLMNMPNRVKPMDDIVKRYGDKIEEKNIIKKKMKNDNEEHVYGIEVENRDFFKGTELENFKVILSIGMDGEYAENTEKLLDLIFK